MPRDASGNFSLPLGYLAITGETIQASQHNPPLEDLAQGVSNSLPRNGTAPMSGALKLADGTAAAPSLTFASNPGTGLFKTAAGIGLAIGGVKTAELTFQLPVGLGPLPWSRFTAPPGWVLCYGQTLSRVTCPDLWIVAQAEIAAGSLFYNNGDGSTTFGIGDMRGRVAAGTDSMGGAFSGRLGFPNSVIPGAAGGANSAALTSPNLPPHTHSGATGAMNQNANHSHTSDAIRNLGPGGGAGNWGSGSFEVGHAATINSTNLDHAHGFTTDNGPGASTPFSIIQPTMATSYILFVGA